MIKIDHGIPMPPMTRRGRAPKYPFDELEVGDSFAIPAPDMATSDRLRGLKGYYEKKLGRMFSAHVLIEDGTRVVRVWRRT